MRRPWHVVAAYWKYRRVRIAAHARQPPGLVKSAFLFEGPLTCYSMSIWERQPQFSAFVPEHIDAVNRIFGALAHRDGHGPELWSTTWRLDSVSNNLRWDDFDLQSLVISQSASLRPIGEAIHDPDHS